jgi:hypothetical protein
VTSRLVQSAKGFGSAAKRLPLERDVSVRHLVAVALATTIGTMSLSAQKAAQKGSGSSGGGKISVGVELRVSQEVANPGGIAQIKVSLTEPKPISTGLFGMSGDFGELMGVSLFDSTNSTYGLAWPAPGGLRVVTSSPLSTLGVSAVGYPILTLTVRVPATTIVGTTLPVHLNPSLLRLFDPLGDPYPTKVIDGSITVRPAAAVEDVRPGSDIVPAGGTISILGRNFTPDVRITVSDASTQRPVLISPTQFDVDVKDPVDMHSREIRLRSSTERSSYFSYQRTTVAFVSSVPVLTTLEPLFPGAGATEASVEFPAAPASTIQALLVKNAHLAPVTLSVSRTSAGEDAEWAAPVTLPAASRFALSLSEIFGTPCLDTCVVTATATASVHTMGVVVDEAMTYVRLVGPK